MATTTTAFGPLGAFVPRHDLWTRLGLSFNRLEQEKYWPAHVFQRDKQAEKWPGDTEGRTLLAWVLLAQATGRPARYLEEMLDRWPEEVNERGYFGRIYTDGISEQQLSSHGWVLRALAELDRYQPDSPAAELARPVIEHLFLPTAGAYADYPIDPSEREAAGEYSGSHLKQVGRWILSTDVGCYAIGMAGVIDAFAAWPDDRLESLIEPMVERFLEIDLAAIGAQTHATLSGCRGMLRWADLSDRPDLIDAVQSRYRLYTGRAWTETYANYNWFGRPQWTEPCAVVDALMVAMELWRRTGEPAYLEDAHRMYFNALGHGQRANGGFGCDTCPGADGEAALQFRTVESHWCCTMRGAEGLARMSQYQAALRDEAVLLPFGLSGDLVNGRMRLHVDSDYPRAAAWRIRNTGEQPATVRLFVPGWVEARSEPIGQDRWLEGRLAPGEVWVVTGELAEGERELLPATARHNPAFGAGTVRYHGPRLLGRYGEQWQPIGEDYLRGDMSKETSAKTLIVLPRD